jgi:pimeloyl-ACP methyl ester carboxylesterase
MRTVSARKTVESQVQPVLLPQFFNASMAGTQPSVAPERNPVKSLFNSSALIFAFNVATLGIVAPAQAAGGPDKPTVVLVHGAFDDGSGWNTVVPSLLAKGLKVVSVQNPLSSLADDVAATRRVLDVQTGPVVLVGHSWGGMVITEVGNHLRVKSLVYVAAFAPSVGQSINDLTKDYPKASGLDHVIVDKEGFVTMSFEGISKHFAQDVPTDKQRLMSVVQGPIRAAAFDEKVTVAAWTSKPSWFIVADQDRMIQPALQLDNARKISAKIVRVPASHVPQLSQSKEVTRAILEAATAAHQ